MFDYSQINTSNQFIHDLSIQTPAHDSKQKNEENNISKFYSNPTI
jgi:hypothetical protein